MRRDDVVVTEPRHRAAAIHEDLQQRFFGDHLDIRARRPAPPMARRARVPGAEFRRPGDLSDTRRAPIARGPQQRLEAGTRGRPAVYS